MWWMAAMKADKDARDKKAKKAQEDAQGPAKRKGLAMQTNALSYVPEDDEEDELKKKPKKGLAY